MDNAMTKVMFFDLDGTLLPMDYRLFMKVYFEALSQHVTAFGDTELIQKAIFHGVAAMMRNTDPARTCEQVFVEDFSGLMGVAPEVFKPVFDDFYETKFDAIGAHFPAAPRAAKAVELALDLGYTCVLATNPVFPAVATYRRIAWAGLNPAWFSAVTTYEGCSFCKPNPQYFVELMRQFRTEPQHCRMVGNDEAEDIECAQKAGISTFFLTETPIMRPEKTRIPTEQGNFDDLLTWLSKQ